MILLIIFAFIGGLVTVASPCILPVLPLVLSAGTTGSSRRPYGIVAGFVLSFTFFTLFLSTIVNLIGLPADIVRNVAIAVIILFGLTLVVPSLNTLFERLTSGVAGQGSALKTRGGGFFSGLIFGLSLGLLWTPCVGPILATVITLAQTGSVSGSTILITLAYATGTALPMLAVIKGGRNLINKVPSLTQNLSHIQKAFGVLAIIIAIAMYLGWDRKLQTFVLDTFPSYGTGLTSFEVGADVSLIQKKQDANDRGIMQTVKENLSDAIYPMAPEIIPGGQFINTKPINLQSDLRGKVVLLDFWTYTCINCIRTFPYLKSWYQKYKDAGFVILGVHTPEFEFEKDYDNVLQAVKDAGITYPVVQDNKYDTWSAYQNKYWPAHYLIDRTGRVRYTHFGEGEYDTTEKAIQQLLSEKGEKISQKINNQEERNFARTRETYLGSDRMEWGRVMGELEPGTLKVYIPIPDLKNNEFTLDGQFVIDREFTLGSKGASFTQRFHAKKVFIVMHPVGGAAKVKVYLDGKPVPNDVRGEDVTDSAITVDKNRLYTVVDLKNSRDATYTIEVVDGEVEFYAVTFG